MSNSLDPDQARHFVGPYLGPNCLQRLSADGTCRQRVYHPNHENYQLHSHLMIFFGSLYIYIANNMDPDQTAKSSLTLMRSVCFHDENNLESIQCKVILSNDATVIRWITSFHK